ncbi:histone deacetylase [Trypanosoma theileri]|uniref:Histone deacetylase n=1 Tax=Trypanosoma theileri TaxID=67003 RepID=A0A1X0NJV3_9TRYP|nr:histone deacetylase [Trypanosoma theileri]ORC85015.1 histone deacetylase [Trypanosoma theileri]
MPKRLGATADAVNSKKNKKAKVEHQNGVTSTAHVPDDSIAAVSKKRFEAYVQQWMSETSGARRPPPTSLPFAEPIPTILDLMMPLTTSSTHKDPFLNNNGINVTHSIAVTVNKKAEEPTLIPYAEGTGVVYDDVMLQHESTDPEDYERPGRLKRTLDHLRAIGLMACCRRIPRHIARTKELRLVHSIDHIDSVDQLEFAVSLRKPGSTSSIGQDLYANISTSKAARMAAGCAVSAALSVVRGEVRNAFALVRPPGHHASANSASGFCFFNNVAVAVRVAQQELRQRGTSAPKALVLDWDVHHCDGTESIFYEDPSVVVVSIHQYGSGRGHVLRKTPSVFTDTIDVNSLAALMEQTTAEEPNSNVSTSDGRECGGDDGSKKDSISPTGKRKKENDKKNDLIPPPERKVEEKRLRKPVDYEKLAADIGEDDEAIARLFGITLDDRQNDMSSSSSDSSISKSNGSLPTSSSTRVVAGRLPGDTEGFSFEEDVNGDTHEAFYPGTGHIERVGGEEIEAARGKNINIPWPVAGMGDLEYIQVLLGVVAPVIREFSPDIVFISCGFDSACGDLLGAMRMSASGYYLLTKAVAALCPRLVVVLEGGYHLSNVARCSEAVMRALLECSGTVALPRSGMLWCQTEELIKQVQRTHEGYWKCFSQHE